MDGEGIEDLSLSVLLGSPGDAVRGFGVATRVAFWTSPTGLRSDINFVWNSPTSQLLVADGTAARPAYSFVSDSDTGMRYASGGLALSTSGVTRVTIAGSGEVAIPSFGGGAGLLVLGTAEPIITTDTADGSDTKRLIICGGGNNASSRGATFGCFGNEQVPFGGLMQMAAGNVSSGEVNMYVGAGIQALTVRSTGTVGILDTAPFARLSVRSSVSTEEVIRLETVGGVGTYSAFAPVRPDLYAIQGRVLTTDATVTTLQAISFATSVTVLVESRVVARRTGGAAGTAEDSAGYLIYMVVKSVAGVATIVGLQTLAFAAEDQVLWNATWVSLAGGVTLSLRVTGAVSNNITWHVTTIITDVST